jgi:hypothetical protein
MIAFPAGTEVWIAKRRDGYASGYEHLFDPRQVIRQMAKIALGCRSPRFAVGIADDTGINCGFGFGDGSLKVFKGQLACVRIQLFGFLAVKGMAQFCDQVSLAPLPRAGQIAPKM